MPRCPPRGASEAVLLCARLTSSDNGVLIPELGQRLAPSARGILVLPRLPGVLGASHADGLVELVECAIHLLVVVAEPETLHGLRHVVLALVVPEDREAGI